METQSKNLIALVKEYTDAGYSIEGTRIFANQQFDEERAKRLAERNA